MKKALIFEGHIVEICQAEFPISPEMHWLDVDDDVSTKTHRYENGVAVPIVAVPTPLIPLQQIRALEQAHDDDQRKLNRQSAIDTALTIACRNPAALGKTRAEVHAIYYATNRGYKTMVDVEAQCAALRKLIV